MFLRCQTFTKISLHIPWGQRKDKYRGLCLARRLGSIPAQVGGADLGLRCWVTETQESDREGRGSR